MDWSRGQLMAGLVAVATVEDSAVTKGDCSAQTMDANVLPQVH
jgi:hypothetical protein